MKGSPVYYDFDKEMQQVAIFLNAEADLIADRLELRIKQMAAAGMGKQEILAVLRREARAGGSLFSGLSSAFKRHVFPVIDNVAQGAVIQENPIAQYWKWLTTSYDPCDDCKPRHGQIKTWEEWSKAGLPRSGFSKCGDHCKCVLAPKDSAGASMADGPVVVPSLAQARSDFDQRMQSDPDLQARIERYRASMRARKN